MKRIKTLLLIAIFAFAILGGWKAGSCELANIELQEDMLDLASQVGSYSRFATEPRSDDDYREAVVRDALSHDIRLKGSQVTVRHTDSGNTSKVYLAADYTETVTVAGYSFDLHFTPTSDKKLF